MPRNSRIIILEERAFWDMYNPLCRAIPNASETLKAEVQNELQLLTKDLQNALARKWSAGDDKDYHVGMDWNVCWHHFMAIFSARIHCAEFLDTVQRTLAAMSHDWCFHVSCQCDDLGDGQIFFYRGKIYGDGSESLDYGLFD